VCLILETVFQIWYNITTSGVVECGQYWPVSFQYKWVIIENCRYHLDSGTLFLERKLVPVLLRFERTEDTLWDAFVFTESPCVVVGNLKYSEARLSDLSCPELFTVLLIRTSKYPSCYIRTYYEWFPPIVPYHFFLCCFGETFAFDMILLNLHPNRLQFLSYITSEKSSFMKYCVKFQLR
jgi:hypothetical protein